MQENIAKELDEKVNFNSKREIQEYQPQGGFRPNTEVFTVIGADLAFKLLCAGSEKILKEFSTSQTQYKVKYNKIFVKF